jgi:hypothetical protein
MPKSTPAAGKPLTLCLREWDPRRMCYGGGPTMIWSITMAAAALVRTAIHG